MNALRSTLAALCLSALLASPALAQGRGFGMGMGPGLPVRLLTVEKVQKELALDDSQVEKSKALAADVQAKMRSNFEQLQGLEGEERIKKGQEIGKQMAEENKKALSAFLKPDQIKRLRQLGLQQRGGMAFNDPEVQKELKFTDAQTEKVKSSVQDMMSQMRRNLPECRRRPRRRSREVSDAQQGVHREVEGGSHRRSEEGLQGTARRPLSSSRRRCRNERSSGLWTNNHGFSGSLHRHALGQVPRLVDVAAARAGRRGRRAVAAGRRPAAAGRPRARRGSAGRRRRARRASSSPSVPTAIDRAAPGLDLLDVAQRLVVQRAPRGDEDARASRGRPGRSGRASSRRSGSPRRGCS